MAHDAEKWRRILSDFQDAFARHGDALFAIYGVPYGKRSDAFNQRDPRYDIGHPVGMIPFDDNGTTGLHAVVIRPGEGFTPLAEIEQGWIDSGIPVDVRCEEAIQAFEELAGRAGASLPPAIRDSIPVQASGPSSTWLALMWWTSFPDCNEFLEEIGTPLIWSDPFLSAISTIEACQLTSDSPRFPLEPADAVDCERKVPTAPEVGEDVVSISDVESVPRAMTNFNNPPVRPPSLKFHDLGSPKCKQILKYLVDHGPRVRKSSVVSAVWQKATTVDNYRKHFEKLNSELIKYAFESGWQIQWTRRGPDTDREVWLIVPEGTDLEFIRNEYGIVPE